MHGFIFWVLFGMNIYLYAHKTYETETSALFSQTRKKVGIPRLYGIYLHFESICRLAKPGTKTNRHHQTA